MLQTLPGWCELVGRTDLLLEWDVERNRPLTPEDVARGSRKRVWWRCGKGHSWQAAVKSRTGGTGCPVCAKRVIVPGENDLATTHPALAAQWDIEKNGPLTPEQVAAGSSRKVWWRCADGHVWKAVVSSRTGPKECGCPVCAGKVKPR